MIATARTIRAKRYGFWEIAGSKIRGDGISGVPALIFYGSKPKIPTLKA